MSYLPDIDGSQWGPQLVSDGSQWGPQLVVARNANGQVGRSEPELVRPEELGGVRVALVCPNCGGPLPPAASYKFAICAYCKCVSADVTRKPSAPAAQTNVSDDGTCWMGFGPVSVSGYAKACISLSVQIVFRMNKLFVDPSCAHAFDISDLRVGKDSQLISPNPIPASACAVGEGLSCGLVDTATPGILISIEVINRTAMMQSIRGMLRGKTMVEPRRIGVPFERDAFNVSYPPLVRTRYSV